MGRVKANISINGQDYWALFDGGAINTYVVEDVALRIPTFELDKPEPVSLGGEVHRVTKHCYLTCLVEGLPIQTHARVLKEIGKDKAGKRIELLIGALAMQEWGIVPIPEEERLDMTHYPKEFVEY